MADSIEDEDLAPAEAAKRGGGLRRVATAAHGFAGLMEPVRHFAVNMGVLAGLLLGGPAVYKQVTKASFAIKDISVPPAVASRGLTGDVIAQQIFDHITEIKAQAGTSAERAEITGFDFNTSTMPPINSPVGGFNLAAVIAEMRSLFGIADTKVTGEIYLADTADPAKTAGSVYGLRLRIAGEGPIYRSEQPSATVEPLVEAAAQQIMRKFDPVNLGYYYYRKKQFRRTIELADEVLASGSAANAAWAYMMRGLVARDQFHYAEAVTDLHETVTRRPDFALGHVRLSEVLLLTEDVKAAEAAARRAIELAPSRHEGHAALARVMLESDRHDEAVATFKKGTEVEPRAPHAYLQLGRAMVQLQRYPEAIAAFRVAAGLSASAEPMLLAAHAAKAAKNDDEAFDFVREAVRLEPKDAHAWVALGEANLDRKGYGRAFRAFQKAIALDAHPVESLLVSVRALDAHRRFAESNQLLEHPSPKLIHEPMYLLGMSEHLWAEGKKQEAAAKMHEAMANPGIKVIDLQFAANLLADRGDYQGALDAYGRAIALDPSQEKYLKPYVQQMQDGLKQASNPAAPARAVSVSPAVVSAPVAPAVAAPPSAPLPSVKPVTVQPAPAASAPLLPSPPKPAARPQAQAAPKPAIATGTVQ